MKLLVITPTLGRSRFLEETIASVEALRPQSHHVLVCPPHAISLVKARRRGAEVVASSARGVYASIEAGLQAVDECDAWTWLNDDDLFCPDAMTRGLRRFADADCDGVYGRVHYCDARGQSLGPLPVESRPVRLRTVFSSGIPALTQQGTFIRKEFSEKLGVFDSRFRLAADFDYWARAIRLGCRFTFHPEVVAKYRLHAGQMSGDTDTVAGEIAESVAMNFPEISRGRARVGRVSFRIRHAPDLLRRLVASRCLSTASLYRKAARVEALL